MSLSIIHFAKIYFPSFNGEYSNITFIDHEGTDSCSNTWEGICEKMHPK